MKQDVLPQVLLATVADQGEWTAGRTDDGGTIHEAALVRATLPSAGERGVKEVPVSLHGMVLVAAGLRACGGQFLFGSLRWRQIGTNPTTRREIWVGK